MTALLTAVHGRLTRLAATLAGLRGRVRDAVASELGKAVGDAVRDLVATLVRHRPGGPVELEEQDDHPSRPARRYDPWDDDDAGWDDRSRENEDHWRPNRPTTADEVDSNPTTPEPRASRWASALTLGATAARWVVDRRGPPWAGAVIGGLVLAAALGGGPVVRAAVAAVHAAAELVALAGGPL